MSKVVERRAGRTSREKRKRLTQKEGKMKNEWVQGVTRTYTHIYYLYVQELRRLDVTQVSNG